MGRHAGIPGLSRSVGQAVERGAIPSLLKFFFNGTVPTTSAQTSVQFVNTNEGAISFSFIVTDSSVLREIVGGDTIEVSVNTSNQMVTKLHGTTTTHTALVVQEGTEYSFSLTWPATGAGKATLDVTSDPSARGATDSAAAMLIGRSQLGNSFMGPIWDVKVYSDEAMTNVLNHWIMNEGSGLLFHDIVGSDDVAFSTDAGDWAPKASVTNGGLPVTNDGDPITN